MDAMNRRKMGATIDAEREAIAREIEALIPTILAGVKRERARKFDAEINRARVDALCETIADIAAIVRTRKGMEDKGS
jgi:hypothetical protein